MSDFNTPPSTDGERMVWAAAFAAAMVVVLRDDRRLGVDRELEGQAGEAADAAWAALHGLRAVADSSADFSPDALAVIGERKP
ncbi:MAG TPA: hypothetical protein VFT22_07140 [Kofleriaceae bacterium]|nr:hypothetical protein [Kofleriaceae bacterium]